MDSVLTYDDIRRAMDTLRAPDATIIVPLHPIAAVDLWLFTTRSGAYWRTKLRCPTCFTTFHVEWAMERHCRRYIHGIERWPR